MAEFYEEKECGVNLISMQKQIASNMIEVKEFIREAISNSIDAYAENITIGIGMDSHTKKYYIEISDDGIGMDIVGFESFFRLGESAKNKDSIGNKGIGTKTFFKCEELIVTSQKNGRRYVATLEKPWEKLNKGICLKYKICEIEPIIGQDGTVVKIVDYKADHIREKYFRLDVLKDYIRWYTACGSFKGKFTCFPELREVVRNLPVSPMVYLVDYINNVNDKFTGEHPFEEICEYPKVEESSHDKLYRASDDYCRHFGPYHRSTNIDGEFVSVQIYGTVAGYNKRKEIVNLQPGESHKSRFGVILCKDFMYILNTKELLLDDANYNHYHIMINSQNFELTADRNNISNKDSREYEWIIKTAKEILRQEIQKSVQETYFKLRKEEDEREKTHKRISEAKKQLDEYDSMKNLSNPNIPIIKEPYSEAQVIVIFTALLSKVGFFGLKIGTYSDVSTTDMILVDDDNKKYLTEVEYKLSNLFKHKHPIECIDIVVCWIIDIDSNQLKELNNEMLKLSDENGQWILKSGVDKIIKVYELKSILSRY